MCQSGRAYRRSGGYQEIEVDVDCIAKDRHGVFQPRNEFLGLVFGRFSNPSAVQENSLLRSPSLPLDANGGLKTAASLINDLNRPQDQMARFHPGMGW